MLDQLNQGAPGGQIPRPNIPRDRRLPASTPYRVLVTLPITQGDDADPDAVDTGRTLVLDFTYNPTFADIQDAAEALAGALLPDIAYDEINEQEPVEYGDVVVLAIERRT